MKKMTIANAGVLDGTVMVSGAKNASLPILFGAVLTDDLCVIENIPRIRDTALALEMLQAMGAGVRRLDLHTYEIDSRGVAPGRCPEEMIRQMRASVYLLGAELARFGHTHSTLPGGCDFGNRPIDQHIKAMEALGARVTKTDTAIAAQAEQLRGAEMTFDVVSVGATVNALLCAVLAQGRTVIHNASREPHIEDFAAFLNACGARISGAGGESIVVDGVPRLHGTRYRVMPDMMEAGTYLIAAAAVGGCVRVEGVVCGHLSELVRVLRGCGAEVIEEPHAVTVCRGGPLQPLQVSTEPYPGFPTDLHPQLAALLCLAEGESRITETIWANRFRYTEQLIRAGADIRIEGHTAVIRGVPRLHASRLTAVDLRAGAAAVIAALLAEGESDIEGLEVIERGYEDIAGKLRSLGATVTVTDLSPPAAPST
ncbi:MAG: UDP-N-acetylglucosamine 1-carboxyvinyltransferase [Eubacteriales bacterium]